MLNFEKEAEKLTRSLSVYFEEPKYYLGDNMKRFTFLPLMFTVWFTMSIINTASAWQESELSIVFWFFVIFVVLCLIVIGVVFGLMAFFKWLFRSIRSSEDKTASGTKKGGNSGCGGGCGGCGGG